MEFGKHSSKNWKKGHVTKLDFDWSLILGDDDEDDGGLFGKDEDDDREMEDSKGIMASDFFAPSTFEKRTKRVRAELDELEAEQIKEYDL